MLAVATATATALGAIVVAVLLPAPGREPDLVQLLRFMALLKGVIAMGAVMLIWRRLARPVDRPRLIGYVAGAAAAALSVVWLWSQWQMGWGVLLFYSALALLLVTARRDRDLVTG